MFRYFLGSESVFSFEVLTEARHLLNISGDIPWIRGEVDCLFELDSAVLIFSPIVVL
jgi:hypothetical protein